MSKSNSHPKGISIMEVLFALFIMSVVFFAVIFFYSTGQKHFVNQGQKADSMFESRHPVLRLTQDIKNAVQVLPGPLSVNGSSLSTGTNCIILQVPSIDSDGLILDIDNRRDMIIYWQDSQDGALLMRAVLTDPYSARVELTRQLIGSLHSFDLGFYDSSGNEVTLVTDTSSVDVKLSAIFSGIGRDFQESFNTSVMLRNKSND